MMVSQFEPSDFNSAKAELGDEIRYVGHMVSDLDYDPVDMVADLRALAARLESLAVAEIMSRRKLVVAQ